MKQTPLDSGILIKSMNGFACFGSIYLPFISVELLSNLGFPFSFPMKQTFIDF